MHRLHADFRWRLCEQVHFSARAMGGPVDRWQILILVGEKWP